MIDAVHIAMPLDDILISLRQLLTYKDNVAVKVGPTTGPQRGGKIGSKLYDLTAASHGHPTYVKI